MRLSEKMFEVLVRLREGKTTEFGYTKDCRWQFLNANTIKALIKRGMLEQSGEMPWNGHHVALYQISETGKQMLKDKGF